MSGHKFTGDRSDMAHRIKRELRSTTAIQPPPVMVTKPRDLGKTEIISKKD